MTKLIVLISALTLFSATDASAAQAQITHLQCGSSAPGSGTTTVVYTGAFMGQVYLNITNVNPMGFPFTQQAVILGSSADSESITLQLRTMLTNSQIDLRLERGTQDGYLVGQDGLGIKLTCSADINIL